MKWVTLSQLNGNGRSSKINQFDLWSFGILYGFNSMCSTLISHIWSNYFLLKIFHLKKHHSFIEVIFVCVCQFSFLFLISFQNQLWHVLDKSWQNEIKSRNWTGVHLNNINSVSSFLQYGWRNVLILSVCQISISFFFCNSLENLPTV